MTLFTLSPSLLRGLACAVWLAVLLALAIRRPAWRAAPGGLRLLLAGLAVIGAGVLIGAAFTALHRIGISPDRIAMEAVGLIAGGLALAGVLRYRPPVPMPVPMSSVPPPGMGSRERGNGGNAGRVADVVDRAAAGVMVAALDENHAALGPVIYANPVAQDWLRRAIEADQPPTLAGLFAVAGRGGLWEPTADTLRQERPACELLTLPRDAAGQPCTVRLVMAPARDHAADADDRSGLVLAVLEAGDSEASSALERLQAEGAAAMPRLAAGLAHDFSNVLTVILTASEILLMDEGLPTPLRQRIERMSNAARRGADLTEKLRAFAGRLDLAAEALDLHEFLREQAVEFKSALGSDIELYYELADGECPVLIDPARMRAALMNVLAYCRAVLPEGGRVSFYTRFEATSWQKDAPPGAVVLTIARSGTRHDMDYARRLLEEPYSIGTSSVAGGGFGLSLVAGFIRQSGGQARFVDEPGSGPILQIELPLVAPSSSAVSTGATSTATTGAGAQAPAVESSAPATPHVLVVDDDELMREAAVAELASLGCTATTAATADEALALLERDAAITSVLSDIGLEGGEAQNREVRNGAAGDRRDGLWLARQIGARFPHLRVVLMSGDIARAAPEESGNAVLLSKPFSRARLAESLDLPPRR